MFYFKHTSLNKEKKHLSVIGINTSTDSILTLLSHQNCVRKPQCALIRLQNICNSNLSYKWEKKYISCLATEQTFQLLELINLYIHS